MKQVITVIGYGRFGKLVALTLAENCPQAQVSVISSRQHSNQHHKLKFVTKQQLKQADVVIPCVPISAFENKIKSIAPFLKKDALVVDVCSVKVVPATAMKKHLPKSVGILATHPMFGPDSVRKNKGLRGLPIVLSRIRISSVQYQSIKKFCHKLGLKVLEMTPRQHDQYAAMSHAYSFLIGKVGQRMKIKATPIDTIGFKMLLEQQAMVGNDSEQLYLDLETQNPFSQKMRSRFKKVVKEILKQLESSE